MTRYTRREFTGLAATTVTLPLARSGVMPARSTATVQRRAMTAQALLDDIKRRIGVSWRDETVDGITAGDAATQVTGIVTTALPTLGVLKKAVDAGANVVIASQPTFYSRTEGRAAGPTPPLASPADPVIAAKRAFVERHALVVMRLSDHWRARESDPMAAGLAEAMGWTRYRSRGSSRRVEIPETTLASVVTSVGKALHGNGGVRVVGDPAMRVRRIGLLPGVSAIQAALELLPAVDVIVAGEVREWETVEYVRDQVASGAAKALILVGRVVSEEPGMIACADWLRTLAPGLPVTHVGAGDPYWRPGR